MSNKKSEQKNKKIELKEEYLEKDGKNVGYTNGTDTFITNGFHVTKEEYQKYKEELNK